MKTEALREAKDAPKKDEKYVLAVQLLVQDYSLAASNQIAKVLLIEKSDKPSHFFKGIKIEELLKKKDPQ